jgi:glycosyltransferase involved in cell wall biosynthesis
MPKLTCITTTYNDGATAFTAIQSVLSQSFPDFQYIIVDDGSTDDTLSRLQAITDPRVLILSQANDGLSSARNRALRHAKGDYVCFLDSDDVRPSWSFATLAAIIDHSTPDVILCRGVLSEVRGDLTAFYDEGVFAQLENTCPDGRVARGDPDFARLRPLMQRIEPQSANKAIRTQFLRDVGLQFPNGHFFEDIFFHTGLVATAQSVAFAYAPCFTYFRRYMRPQITATSGDRRFDSIAVSKLTLEYFARTLEFHDPAIRTAVLVSCLRVVAWCESTISHPLRPAFRQTVRAVLAGLDPLYLNVPPDLPPVVGALDQIQHYLAEARDAA